MRYQAETFSVKKVLTTVALSAAVAISLSSCAPPESSAPNGSTAPIEVTDVESLVEAAQSEGQVRVYASLPEAPLAALADAFKEKYGIEVSALRLGGDTLASRFDAETASSTPSGEVVIGLDPEFMNAAISSGALAGFSSTGIADLLDGFPERAVFEEYDVPLIQYVESGFIYNTDKVSEGDIPSSWEDLGTSRWVGNYCAVDPNQSVNSAHQFWKLGQQGGEQALVDFGADIGRWYPNVISLNEAVSSGECELGVDSANFLIKAAKANGAPVEFAVAPSSVPPVMTGTVSTAADHPNAARLFLHFLLSKEGNDIVNNADIGAIGPWDMDRIPEGFQPPKLSDFQQVRDETADIISLLGL